MKRRDYIKTFLLGSVLPMTSSYAFSKSFSSSFKGPVPINFKSEWQFWQDMKWVGPQYWGNRLQDWRLEKGRVICDVTAANRNLHLLTVQNPKGNIPFQTSVTISNLNNTLSQYDDGCIGLRIGAKGPFDDYRSAAVFGKGLDVGLTPNGKLKIGKKQYETNITTVPNTYTLELTSTPLNSETAALTVIIRDSKTNAQIVEQHNVEIAAKDLQGNFALLSDVNLKRKTLEQPSVAFENWNISSKTLYYNPNNFFGPICFAQYTLHKQKLKLTAQCSPIELVKDHKIKLQFKVDGAWTTQQETTLNNIGRAVNFQVPNWEHQISIPYRVRLEIPLKNSELYQYDYEGTIAAEPKDKDHLKAAVFSCNAHYGFPDADIHESISILKPDISMFLGDQFYEFTGGYGAQYNGELDKSSLDYLRKWMMFGWSYREIFRHIPCAIIPDDHDVYHGNVWGEGGKLANNSEGFGYKSQDSGGYKMQPEWVNMVQFTQTSHLPDPYDPTPAKNSISVYYTNWDYAGVSFAILEDRKFKSAPKHILPKSAQVENGWILNKDFDIKEYKHLDAELLGERQEAFLKHWVEEWSKDTQMKAVLSQTNFATVATLPKDAVNDEVVPSLPIPEIGEYVVGDKPTVDMDSNGWPAVKRDQAVSIIRKAHAFHIAGDQHLGSFVQYGVDTFGDSGFAFAGPALNNVWPRRFWPPIEDTSKHSYENPAYTGNHIDGFGNKITVLAAGNPHNMHKEPKILYNRAVGYGIVTFNKKDRTIKTDCYKRFSNPNDTNSQFPGWPITISEKDNFGKKAEAWLPTIVDTNKVQPLVAVYDSNSELVYNIRMHNNSFNPKVFTKGRYTIVCTNLETGKSQTFKNIKAKATNTDELLFTKS
ncbi:alkaline phosphatase D family protein [Snuella sedimenti]|uniref:Alkaline phosphatase D family protein n=1 Tax=Snuella sedimenti TaxID=2798802 RepID=A0A8J7LSK6_9FLAO|nr:alkaline phosphatase D family protein [Snuella sedimenti]MBJ6367326.1 alkaline phosphatase D family protein [Snuella sedimenti]